VGFRIALAGVGVWTLIEKHPSLVLLTSGLYDLTAYILILAGQTPKTSNQGPIFRTFFSAENHFPRKIPQNILEIQFFKTFSAENSIFSQHFWGKFSAEFSPKFSPEKNVRKIDPS
jgi:hypothetical protein